MQQHDVIKFPIRRDFFLELNDLVFCAVRQVMSIGTSISAQQTHDRPEIQFSRN